MELFPFCSAPSIRADCKRALLEAGEILIRPIPELQSTPFGLSHQYLNWLVCGVYKSDEMEGVVLKGAPVHW